MEAEENIIRFLEVPIVTPPTQQKVVSILQPNEKEERTVETCLAQCHILNKKQAALTKESVCKWPKLQQDQR